jgi:hypothetical protein
MQLTPTQLIKKAILTEILEWAKDFEIKTIPETPEDIDKAWDIMRESDIGQDICEEWRQLGIDTDLPAPFNRNYEIDIVARKIENHWISWPYEYGGSKHQSFSPYDWVEDAEFVDCKEEEKLVVARTFSKKV